MLHCKIVRTSKCKGYIGRVISIAIRTLFLSLEHLRHGLRLRELALRLGVDETVEVWLSLERSAVLFMFREMVVYGSWTKIHLIYVKVKARAVARGKQTRRSICFD